MADSAEQAKLKRRARLFRMLASVAVTLTLLCVGSEILLAAAPLWKGGDAHQALMNTGIQIVVAAPALCYVVGLRCARQVFLRIGAGEMLTPENSKGLERVGRWLLAGALWSLLISNGLEPLQPPQISQLGFDPGQIGVGARDIALAALGLALLMIGRVLAAAARLKAENDSFV